MAKKIYQSMKRNGATEAVAVITAATAEIVTNVMIGAAFIASIITLTLIFG